MSTHETEPGSEKKTWLDDASASANVMPQNDARRDAGQPAIVIHDSERTLTKSTFVNTHSIVGANIHSLLEDNSSALPRRVASLTGPELIALQVEWGAGAMTVQQMCDMWGVARGDLMKLAERWGARAVRDEYRSRLAEGLIDEEQAIGRVAHVGFDTLPRDSSAAVDRAVARAVDVVRSHKRDIGEARAMAMAVLRQAEDNELTTIQRAGVVEKAVNALAKAITLERQAYGIVDDASGNTDAVVPLEERLRAYTANGGILPKPAAGRAA